MIDISDGLAADLGHILEESRVGAVIEERLIPKNQHARLNQALYGGEDFELLFTLQPAKAKRLHKQRKFKFTCIGEIVHKRGGLQLKTAKGRLKKLNPKGYTHF